MDHSIYQEENKVKEEDLLKRTQVGEMEGVQGKDKQANQRI